MNINTIANMEEDITAQKYYEITENEADYYLKQK